MGVKGQGRADDLETTLVSELPERTDPRLAALPSVSAGPVGSEIELGEVLGVGGFSVVRRGWQAHLGRHVAVKAAKVVGDAKIEQSLVEEARWTARVGHPNVVPVHQVGHDPSGAVVIVLQEIQGESLLATLKASPPKELSDFRRYVNILVAVGRALGAAHEGRVVHCDVKPHNVFLGLHGEVYLGDWGVARELGETYPVVRGTPGYVAPEIVLGEPADARTDVYLLGATLHHVLTGTRRHKGADLDATLDLAVASAAAVYGPEVPPGLGRIANRACAAKPGDRYADIAAMIEALDGWIQESFAESVLRAADEQMREARLVGDWTDSQGEGVGALAVRTHLIKAQFGYERAWTAAQLPEAKAGLSRAIEALVDIELRALDPTSARALAEQHPDPDPAWRAQVDERIAGAQQIVAEQRRLARVGHQADLVHSRQAWLALVVGLSVIVGGAIIVDRLMLARGGPDDQALRRIIGTGLTLVLYLPFRYAVTLGTETSRRNLSLRGAIDGILVLMFTSRLCLQWFGGAPPDWIPSFEMAMLAGWLIPMRHLFRSAAVLAAFLGLMAVVLRILPPGDAVFEATVLFVCLTLAVDTWWGTTPKDREAVRARLRR